MLFETERAARSSWSRMRGGAAALQCSGSASLPAQKSRAFQRGCVLRWEFDLRIFAFSLLIGASRRSAVFFAGDRVDDFEVLDVVIQIGAEG